MTDEQRQRLYAEAREATAKRLQKEKAEKARLRSVQSAERRCFIAEQRMAQDRERRALLAKMRRDRDFYNRKIKQYQTICKTARAFLKEEHPQWQRTIKEYELQSLQTEIEKMQSCVAAINQNIISKRRRQ